MKKYLLVSLLFLSFSKLQAQSWRSDLEQLYRSNPGLVTQGNPEILKKEATRTLKDPAKVSGILKEVETNLDGFLKARSEIIEGMRLNPIKGLKPVVVSGQSVTGMVAAAIAAQSGHKVSVYDLRMKFTRDIQWSSRQSVIDTLASIDPKLAEKFTKEVGKDLHRGYLAMQGEVHTLEAASSMKKGDPRRIPQIAHEMLNAEDVATVQAKVFENLMYDYLSHHPNVTQKKGKIEVSPLDPLNGQHKVTEYEDVTPKGQKEKVYKKVAEGYPLTIVAEGASSSTRTTIGVQSAPISAKRLQVAGVIEIENGGEIVTHYREESPGRMVTGSMGTSGSNKRWVVADIDEARIKPNTKKFGTDPSAPEYLKERTRLLEIEFKRVAALNMRMPIKKVADLEIGGAIEGQPLSTFELQQRISEKGASGTNVLLFGDAVGNGHWSVGGGMHTGAIAHAERFKQYLTAVDGGLSQKAAAQSYSAGVLQDSRTWGEHGLYYFYNNLSHEQAAQAYKEAANLFFEKKVESPERALELMLPGGRASRTVKNIRLNCNDIIKHVLGDI
jgi:2-polyprenyl-6-methoxyphenol hydroxylase-like FAD-dependent oxidoreductase